MRKLRPRQVGQGVSNGTGLEGEGAVILTQHLGSLKHPGNNVEAEASQKQCGWLFMLELIDG